MNIRGYEGLDIWGYEGLDIWGYEGLDIRGYEGFNMRGYEIVIYVSVPVAGKWVGKEGGIGRDL